MIHETENKKKLVYKYTIQTFYFFTYILKCIIKWSFICMSIIILILFSMTISQIRRIRL